MPSTAHRPTAQADGNRPIKHPVVAAVGLLLTGGLVAAVLAGLAKGLDAQRR